VTTAAVASIAAIIPMILMVRMFFAPVGPSRAIACRRGARSVHVLEPYVGLVRCPVRRVHGIAQMRAGRRDLGHTRKLVSVLTGDAVHRGG
jgi:hypothetical protein